MTRDELVRLARAKSNLSDEELEEVADRMLAQWEAEARIWGEEQCRQEAVVVRIAAELVRAAQRQGADSGKK